MVTLLEGVLAVLPGGVFKFEGWTPLRGCR